MQNEKKNSVDGDGRVCAYGNVHTLLLVILSLIISAIKNAMYCDGIVLSMPFFFLGRSQPFK